MVVFVKENNQHISEQKQNNKNTKMDSNNKSKSGFLGTIGAFSDFADKYKDILKDGWPDKPDKLFRESHDRVRRDEKDNIVDRNVVKLEVRYKRKNVDNVAYQVHKIQDKENTNTTKEKVDIFLPVVLDENIEQSIEECEKYNKMMWKKYSNTITEQDKCSQIYTKYKDQFEDYNTNVPKNSDKLEFTNVRGKTAAVIFFYILTVFAVAYLGLYIFAPGLLISCAATFGISAVLATKITSIVLIFALIIGSICFALAMRISAELKKCKKHNQKANEAANLLEVQKYKYTVKNFKDQCKFYSALIDEFIEEHHLRPPERKRAWSVFFYVLMGLAIVFLGFCIFAPGLLISLAAILGISTIIAAQIINASYVLASTIALIFFKLGRYVS